MSLKEELGLLRPFRNKAHETLLNIILTGTLLAKEGSRILQPFGLTDAQFNVLMLLKFQSLEGKLNQTSLGNMLLVNRSNVTGLIDRMEAAGLVNRTADPEDRRVKHIVITDAGRQVLEKASRAYFSCIDQIMSELQEDEFAVLTEMLERVRKRLRVTKTQ